jgi:serine/threonine protein kinase
MAPEMIEGDEKEIGKPADIWSLGVTIFYLIERKLPFPDTTLQELQKSIIFKDGCQFSKTISLNLKNCIISMLQKVQYLRPTAQQLWNHPLFHNFKEVANRSKPIGALQPLSLQQPKPKNNPNPKLTFDSVQVVRSKSTQELLIENGICLEKNIHELMKFAEHSEEENSIYYQQKQFFSTFEHIYVIQDDFKDVQKIPEFDKSQTVAILIPKRLKAIPKYYFLKYENLETIHKFADIESLGRGCLYQCDKLKEVLLPENLIQIGEYSFAKCQSLHKIYIPSSVKKLKKLAFIIVKIYCKLIFQKDCLNLKKAVLVYAKV